MIHHFWLSPSSLLRFHPCRQRLKEERLQRLENEQKLQELRSEMAKKESDFEAMTTKVHNYKQKITELENLLEQERAARESLQKNQDILAKMNEKLKEVRFFPSHLLLNSAPRPFPYI